MSHFVDRLLFFTKDVDEFSNGHGVVTNEDRSWEQAYRNRWSYDRIVRSTHGTNCTGSCSWKIYVKGGIVTWETQQTDYPRTRPDLPNHEPRGCARGASYSWYLYSAQRLKFPMVRGRLVRLPAIRNTAVLTVEGEHDDISGIGQTQAVHDLLTGLPASMRADHVQPGVGHYGVFNGSRFRKEIQPRMAEFIRAHDRARSAKVVPFVKAVRKTA